MQTALIDEISEKVRNKRQIYFSKNSEYLRDLSELLSEQNRRTVCLWAFDLASESVLALKVKYPVETRPEIALKAAKAWAHGETKMRQAQRCILDCHAFAKEIRLPQDACVVHAVGQACSVVHTAGHAMGYPIYDLTSVVISYGVDRCEEALEARKRTYIKKLLYYSEHFSDCTEKWADFILK